MKMYYYTALVKLQPEAVTRLAYEAPTLLAYARDRVYVGRTTDPHRRAMGWKMEGTNSLGRTLRRLDNLDYVCYKDYIPMCRVWFCLVGAKNTPESVWDAPEAAFKMLVARTPNKLHSQIVEFSKTRRNMIRHQSTDTFSRRRSDILEANADAILARVFKINGAV
jgi:hypothetical protein